MKKFRTTWSGLPIKISVVLPLSFLISVNSALPLSITLLTFTSGAAIAALESDDVGFYGSTLVQRSAQQGATALKSGNWGEAQAAYIKLIGMRSNEEDFYFGLYASSKNMLQWNQVMRALDELFALKPEYKEKMTLEYGEALFHMNRYDEAEVYLKKALAHVNEESFVDQRIRRLIGKGIIEKTATIGQIPPEIAKWNPEKEKERAPEKYIETKEDPRKALTLENAYLRSEAILLCTYKGYEKTEVPPSFFKPPKAIFGVEEEMKVSSHFNPTIFVRFEFHEDLKEDKPKEWKFSPELLPKKGSKWIIFIPNSIPVEGMYKTYHGKFGILEYSEDNYDKVMKVIKEHQGQG